MKSLWNDQEAAQFPGELAQRVYTSRLLGRDTSLVLHGGGNTSVKLTEKNVFGEPEEILYVKGSGWDLETIKPAGFSPCRMAHLLRLAQLPQLSDPQMADELRGGMTNPAAPAPSVEAILHALLPHKFVDHTHTDALISITNTPGSEARIREIYGDSVVVIPYVMPGFKLARLCADLFPRRAHAGTRGMVLLNHGLFTFGPDARTSYELMIELVNKAEDFLKAKNAWHVPSATVDGPAKTLCQEIASLRRDVSAAAGVPVILSARVDSAFARRPDIGVISQQGPATPDHVIRTKRLPLVGRDVAGYVARYRDYFMEHTDGKQTMLDPAPRVILDPELGLCSIGRTAKDARIVSDIYGHTVDIIQRATQLERWQALPARDIFDVEYWDLEQAKLRKGGKPPVFTGEVALVTGAASGIGKACVESLLQRGAAVVGLDLKPDIATLFKRPDYLGLACDLTNEDAVRTALETAVRAFGGLDIVVLNAGIFPKAAAIADLPGDTWRKVMSINLDANLALLRECHPLLKLAPNRGRVVVIGSKNVPAPGPGAAAYSASKAAMNQLTRVAALEWGADGIRLNSVHPNMVFDTGLWTPGVLEARAKHYGISIEEYKTNNVLKVSITSRDVAELAVEMCGPLFAKTTAAQVPIDGGNDRVI
jgi:rhamnose utilization protein RhaD (predicted bifunctional aldolase and dehydrogenase)/NAD(P)-dependent dehydrogenase (short-subunit alcohol dehydrogenase family)